MGITYEEFSFKPEEERLTYIEDWMSTEHELSEIPEKQVRGFIRSLLEHEKNAYIKLMAIEILAFLTICKKLRRTSSVDILLDIEHTESAHVVATALKYLSVLYDNEEDIVHKLKLCRDSSDSEVSSEAYFRLGVIRLMDMKECTTMEDFYSTLRDSRALFNYAMCQVENRTDAEYLYNVTDYLFSILVSNETKIEESLRKLLATSFIRRALSHNEDLLLLEFKINDILLNIKEIYESANQHESWINYYKEFVKVAQYHIELMSISVSESEFQNRLISSFKHGIQGMRQIQHT